MNTAYSEPISASFPLASPRGRRTTQPISAGRKWVNRLVTALWLAYGFVAAVAVWVLTTVAAPVALAGMLAWHALRGGWKAMKRAGAQPNHRYEPAD